MWDLTKELLQIVLVIAIPVLIPVSILIIEMLCFMIYYYIKGERLTLSISTYKKRSMFIRLFWDFPKQWSIDKYRFDPNKFNKHGLHMFVGEQGTGKTISVAEMLLRLKEIYPMVKIRTNMDYRYQDDSIAHWKDLVSNTNGEYGQIEVLDEIQTWFNSLQSKDFPFEMITEISQQRKQRKMLVGTAQVFERIAKPIREQTTYVYLPKTFLGCLTIVRVTKPRYWNEEKKEFTRFLETYFYIHNDKIRESFDTYKKIERYKEEGFQEVSRTVSNEVSSPFVKVVK